MEFTKAMARRVEGQIRSDFVAVPIIRSVCYKWMIEHASTMIIPFYGKRDQPGSIIASDLMKAAQGLCQTLQNGTITLQSGKKKCGGRRHNETLPGRRSHAIAEEHGSQHAFFGEEPARKPTTQAAHGSLSIWSASCLWRLPLLHFVS